jgi:hypothetical protein
MSRPKASETTLVYENMFLCKIHLGDIFTGKQLVAASSETTMVTS